MESSDLPMIYRYILARRAVCNGTVEQKQSLRAYFLTRYVSDAAQLTHRWNAVGQEICKIIAGVPWMLEVFLGCGYGRVYITTMFMQVLKHDNPAAFLNIIQCEPLAERFAARSGDDIYYKYVWTHYVPVMRPAILDTYLRGDGLVIDPHVFLSIIPSLSPAQLETIMNHPCHRDLVYKLTSPYAYIETEIRTRYKYESCMSETTVIQNYGIPSVSNYKHIPSGCAELETEGNAVVVQCKHTLKGCAYNWHSTVHQYKNAEHLWVAIKAARRARNLRLLFWWSVLHSRMMEFRERYWALEGKHVRAVAAEFYALLGRGYGKN